MLELIHTSAPRGLLDDRRGYTTVACTESMPDDLCAELAQRSTAGLSRLDDGDSQELRAVYRVWPLQLQGSPALVLTRIVPIASDYSGRPARLAHHLVFEGQEASGQVLAGSLLEDGVFVDRWDGQPRRLDPRSAPFRSERGRQLADAELLRATRLPEEWSAYLAIEAGKPRISPCTVLLAESADLRLILAAIVARCGRCRRIRIETSEDQLLDARPSLLVLRRPPANREAYEIVADWSESPGETRPPGCSSDAPPHPNPTMRVEGPLLNLESLPRPQAGRWAKPPTSVPDGQQLEADAEPGVASPRTAAREALGAFAVGVVVGVAIAIASALVFQGHWPTRAP